jgi:1-acyl-sn-glycerol-3-phosphate acyltransferase
MLVFNHSSYADLIVLAAVLPGEPLYVAKRELAGQFFAGPFLRRLGALFVERYDMSGRLADTEAVIAGAREGRNVIFFPEGTFTRRPGLPPSISALQGRMRLIFQFCPVLSVVPARYSAVISGFRAGAR